MDRAIAAGRIVGHNAPVFIVAEISCNHMGDLDRAMELIDAAALAGADAVKFQLFSPEDVTLDSRDRRFTIQAGQWQGRRLWDLYQEAMTPREWFPELFAFARALDVVPFATVLSLEGIRYLETLDCPIYKIASAELPWLELVDAAARTGRPVILSTGMATMGEVTDAIGTCTDADNNPIVLHCVSAYPAPATSMDLRRITRLARVPGVASVGLSDHSKSLAVWLGAVTLGARVIEAHVKAPDTVPLDDTFSLEPDQFAWYVEAVRELEEALGEPRPGVERDSEQFRRREVNGRWVRCAPQ